MAIMKSAIHNSIKKPSLRHHFTRWLYSLLLLLLLPLLLVVFRRKLYQANDKLSNRRFAERFGKVPSTFAPGGVHIHCVSVGELNAAQGIIERLLNDFPHLPVTLTTSSLTGALHAQNLYKDSVQHCYLPIDFPFFMHRFYKQIRPVLCLVTEVEIWPNMVHECVKRNTPVILINARMTNRSLQSYRKLSWLFRGTLRQFHEICAQSSESFENFVAYGLYKKNIKLTQNMKFDLQPNLADEQLGKQIVTAFSLQNKPILIAASTHDTEEKLILDTFQKLKKQHSELILVVVPRHPHRFDSAYQIVKASGFNTIRISDYINADNQPNKSDKAIECLVVDTMGWLKACYSISTLAFIGGSFADKGGHNALEAALYAIPMAMGPSIYNNPIICQHLQEQKALAIVKTPDELFKAFEYWLEHSEQATKDGENGSKVLLTNAGAVESTMSIIRSYIS